MGFACGYKNIGFSYGAPENCGATIILDGDDEEFTKHVYIMQVRKLGRERIRSLLSLQLKLWIYPLKSGTDMSDTSSSGCRFGLSFPDDLYGRSFDPWRSEGCFRKWHAGDRPAIGAYVYRAPATCKMDARDGHCYPNFAYGYVAQAILAEVDLLSGEVHLKEVVCADDVGRAINPKMVEGAD